MLSDVTTDQAGDVGFNPTAFDGAWRLIKDDSTILDEQSGEHVQETLIDQWIEMRTTDGVMKCATHVQIAPDLTIHEEFEVKLNDDKWVPYTLVRVDGDPDHPSLRPSDGRLLKSGLQIGEPSAWVKLTYIDERTTVRTTKNVDGSAQYVLVNRLAEDGNRISGYLMTPDGKLVINKHMIRESD